MVSDTNLDKFQWIYTSNIQLADVDRNRNFIKDVKFNENCYTIMNSNGLGIDPINDKKKRTCEFGSEISIVSNDIDILKNIFKSFIFNHPEASVNNSCQIINQIKIPRLTLDQLKMIAKYYWDHRESLIEISDQISTCDKFSQVCNQIGKTDYTYCENRRFEQTNIKSGTHHAQLEKHVYDLKMNSNSIQEFHNASRFNIDGSLIKFSDVHPIGIDTLSANNNITFRMHSSTLDFRKYHNTLIWDSVLLYTMLTNGEHPEKVYNKLFVDTMYEEVFPINDKLNIELHRKFIETKNDGSDLKREKIKYYINTLK